MKKIIISVIGSNFAASGLGFLLNLLLARILTVEEFGRINLLFSMIILLFSLFEFNFGNAVVIVFNKLKNKIKNSQNLLYKINFIYYIYLLIIMLIAWIIIYIFQKIYSLTNFETLVLMIDFYLFLIYRYIISLYQALGNWKKYNFYNVLHNVMKITITIFSLVIGYYFFNISKYISVLYGYIIYPIIFLALILLSSTKYIRLKIHKDIRLIRYLFNVLIPLGISNIFIIISMRADNFIIEKFLGSYYVGIYAAANMLALLFPLITSGIRNVYLKIGAEHDDNFLNIIFNQQKKYFPIVIIIFIISEIIAKYLFVLIFGENYIESVIVFQILLIAYIGGIFFTPLESFFYSKKPILITKLKFLQMIIIILLGIVLVSKFSIMGMAYAIVISRLVGWIYLLLLTIKRIRRDL